MSAPIDHSRLLFDRARRVIPGGVNSPVRACTSVDSDPLFIERAYGSKIVTVDGAEMIDFVMSWGPMILGHAHPEVSVAAIEAVLKGSSYGAPCPDEALLAEAIVAAMPGVDMVRMVNSGTEATMSALRLARGFTGKNKLVKFSGCYHGHADPFLAAAGSGVATLSIPGTPGVPAAVVADTLLSPYNDLACVEKLFCDNPGEIACVIVEPVAGNMGLVPPAPGFLEGLRRLCDAHQALLIFDEVITGFRVGFGGAQKRYGVTPDLTTLGKIIGGGLPVGAYGGRREIMERIAPCGDVYQAGTLSGNPAAMAAGLKTLELLAKADYAGLERRTATFVAKLGAILKKNAGPTTINHVASMFTIYFTDGPVVDFESAKRGDSGKYVSFFKQMREQGVFLAPSAFEAAMLSFAHSDDDLDAALEAAANVRF